jgi:hypothetical protein
MMSAGDGFRGVQFIKQGLPSHMDQYLVNFAKAKDLMTVREGDRR